MSKYIDNNLTIEEIIDRINGAIPLGAPLKQAVDFLVDNDIEYSVQIKLLKIYAIVRNIKGGGFLSEKSAQIVIYLTKDQTVGRIEITAAYTGL